MAIVDEKLEEIKHKKQLQNERKVIDAILNRNLDKLKYLHSDGFDFSQPFSMKKQQSHPLALAALSSDEVFAYVLEHTDPKVVKEATIDTYDNPIPTMHWLARYNHASKIEILLNSGAVDIEAKDHIGYTAVADAVANKAWDAASLLIERGANITNEIDGTTVRDVLIQKDRKDLLKSAPKEDKAVELPIGTKGKFKEKTGNFQSSVIETVMMLEKVFKNK